MFHICRTYAIPLLLEVPQRLHNEARSLLDDVPDIVQFVDPADVLAVARDILGEP